MGLPSSEFAKTGEYYFVLSVFSSKWLLCFENVNPFLLCLFVSRFSVFTLLSLSVYLFACLFVCVSVCCMSACVSVCCQSPIVNMCLLFRNVFLYKINLLPFLSLYRIYFSENVFLFIHMSDCHCKFKCLHSSNGSNSFLSFSSEN